MLDTYAENKGDPIAFSPSEREGLFAIIEENLPKIQKHFSLIDARMSDLINVLGWSFDAKIIAASLDCKQNIAEFMANADADSDPARLKRLEMYMDTDAASGAALHLLYGVLGRSLETE